MLKKYLPWLVAVLYLLNPYDLVPDFALGAGWLDDLAVVGMVLWWASRLKRAHEQRSTSSTHTGPEQEPAGTKNPREEDPHKVLGVQAGATKEEIKAAYKSLAARYHPDRVQHLGEEFQDLAHDRFVAIQKAYEQLRAKR
jgi:uncharacterized membrane protein YkvA (DUF1232 family)